jgi:hypothetical protein
MSLTSYRAAPPRDVPRLYLLWGICYRIERLSLFRFGGDLLSHVLRRSTIGATALNGRVREGIGCFARAMTTKPKKRQGRFWSPLHQCCSKLFRLSCNIVLRAFVYAFVRKARFLVLLLLDQIKPIEQLVPVS